MKYFVNTFVDIASLDISFYSFLFKSVFFTKFAISLLLAKLASTKLAAKRFDVNLLNY